MSCGGCTGNLGEGESSENRCGGGLGLGQVSRTEVARKAQDESCLIGQERTGESIDERNGYVIVDLGCSNQMTSETALRNLCVAMKEASGLRPMSRLSPTQVRYNFADGKEAGTPADYQATHKVALGGSVLETSAQVFKKGKCPYLSSLPQWESVRALIDLNPLGDGQSWITLRGVAGEVCRPLVKDQFGHIRVKMTDLDPSQICQPPVAPSTVRKNLGFQSLAAGEKRPREPETDVQTPIRREAAPPHPQKVARTDEVPPSPASEAPPPEGSLEKARQLCSDLLGDSITVLFGRSSDGKGTKALEAQPAALTEIVATVSGLVGNNQRDGFSLEATRQVRLSRGGNRVAGLVAEAGFVLNLGTKPIRLRPVSQKRGLMGGPVAQPTVTELGPGEGCSVNPRYPFEVPSTFELIAVLYGDKPSKTAMSRADILKLHLAKYHPSASELIKTLRKAGRIFDPQLVEEVTVKCGCLDKPWTKPRKTLLPGLRTQRPCDVVAQDAKKIVHAGRAYQVQNVMDLHTRIQSLFVATAKGEKESLAAFRQFTRRYGVMEKHLTDNAPEYQGPVLTEEREKQGVRYMATGVASPWSNGVLERSNAEIEKLHDKLHRLYPTLSVQEIICVIDEVLQETTGSLGYTPFESMFGRPRRRIDAASNPAC